MYLYVLYFYCRYFLFLLSWCYGFCEYGFIQAIECLNNSHLERRDIDTSGEFPPMRRITEGSALPRFRKSTEVTEVKFGCNFGGLPVRINLRRRSYHTLFPLFSTPDMTLKIPYQTSN